MRINFKALILCYVPIFCTSIAIAEQESDSDSSSKSSRAAITPDIREDEMRLKLQKGDFVMVPIPISNPTLDSGLVLGAAYFYPQSEEQKKVQPASVTGGAAMKTSNGSYAYGIGQQNYWQDGTWRFNGAFGVADLKLTLVVPDGSGGGQNTKWLISGGFAQAQISRRISGDWYAGLQGRFVDIKQGIEISTPSARFDTDAEVRAVGLGVNIEYDRRDMPLNTYEGRYFQVMALLNDTAFGSDKTYKSYNFEFRSYHELSMPLVLAWEVESCQKGGTVPLWDACRIDLRGFPATDYIGEFSASAQFEARWRMSKRWGLVGFAGGGYVGKSFSEVREKEIIPSYGIGVRFMVLPAKRINIRVDWARSTDSNAVHVSVGEAF